MGILKMRRVTIKDVAKHAKVSTATVSRVVNGLDTVSDKNREKVQKSIKELHYFVNSAASNLKRESSNVIGIVVPTFLNEFFMEIIDGIEDCFSHEEYVFYIMNSKFCKEREKANLRKLCENNVEVIILVTVGDNESFIQSLVELGIEIISVDRQLNSSCTIDFIGEDNYESAQALTKSFLSQIEYQEVVLLGGLENLSMGYERSNGAKSVLDELGVSYTYFDAEHSAGIAEKIFTQIRASYPNGCGIISLNNAMTEGIIRAMEKSGHRYNEYQKALYPVASYGKMKFQSIFTDIIISSVYQNPYQLGVEAAGLLKNKMKGEKDTIVVKRIRNNIL